MAAELLAAAEFMGKAVPVGSVGRALPVGGRLSLCPFTRFSANTYTVLRTPEIVAARIAFFQTSLRFLVDHTLPRKTPAMISGIMIGF